MSSDNKFPQVDLAFGGGRGYQPESELMRAIILRAVEDLNSAGELRDEALAFFGSDNDDRDNDDESSDNSSHHACEDPQCHHCFGSDDDYVFSFRSICHYLGLDPQATRNSILFADHKISTRRRAA